jgi:predicted Rossmann fold nucleotide-binding protein DprA/Smf involved in DNA uptake
MEKTIDYIKKKRTVSEEVKEKRKEFARIKKLILKTLETEPKNIPQIAKETQLPSDIVTFYLMTLRKYGEVITGDIDDMDEYFFYKLK